MRILRSLLFLSLLALPFTAARAEVVVGIGIGPVMAPAPVVAYGPPVCSYGYYPYYPYSCAPYGYYGPDWFVSGVFIGAGPWYHWHGPYYGGPRVAGYYGGRPGWGGRGYGYAAAPGRGVAPYRGGGYSSYGHAYSGGGSFGGGYHGNSSAGFHGGGGGGGFHGGGGGGSHGGGGGHR